MMYPSFACPAASRPVPPVGEGGTGERRSSFVVGLVVRDDQIDVQFIVVIVIIIFI